MAEVDQMTAPDVEPPKPEKKKSSKSKSSFKLNLIVIVVSQLILAGGGFFVVSTFIKPDPAITGMLEQKMKEDGAAHDDDGHGEGGHGEEGHGNASHTEIFLLEDIIVNPAGTRGSRYLSISIGVEMNAVEHDDHGGGGHGAAPPPPPSPLEPRKAQLRDGLINILSSKTILELTTAEEKEKIRAQILEKFTEVLKPEPVYQIYFVDFVLQ